MGLGVSLVRNNCLFELGKGSVLCGLLCLLIRCFWMGGQH